MIRVAAAVVIVLVVAAPAAAHPGRLDATGCHLVRTAFVHKDGRAERVGDYHCHRPLDAMQFDGLERLQGAPVPTAERLRDPLPHFHREAR